MWDVWAERLAAHFRKVLRKDALSNTSDVKRGKNWHVFQIASFWFGGNFSSRGAQLNNWNIK